MLIVKAENNIDQALKVLKHKVQRTKQTQELRERQEYTKPSVKRRNVIKKAQYISRLRADN